MRNKHLKVGFYLPFFMVIIMMNSCSLLLNKKGLQKEKISYYTNLCDDTVCNSNSYSSSFYYYKDLVLSYHTLTRFNSRNKKFEYGKSYFLYDKRYKRILNFDTLENPIFVDTSFEKYKLSCFFSYQTYDEYDTSKVRAHIKKSNSKEMILKAFSLEYKPMVETLYLSKKANSYHTSLAPYFDSIYQKRAYKTIVNDEDYDNRNHFIKFYVKKVITKESFSRKERDTIINFLKSIDTTLLKR